MNESTHNANDTELTANIRPSDESARTDETKAREIFGALETFIKRQARLERANYGFDVNGARAMRQESASITKDRKRALEALQTARELFPANLPVLLDSFRAFSGRLKWNQHNQLQYCTGQYYPTEYRKAAASVLETYVAGWKQAYASTHPRTFVYTCMADVISANQEVGGHWFDKSTMRFFKTRIESGAVPCEYGADGIATRARFITSEKGPREDSPRRYSIREAQADGSIDTVGEFQAYASLKAAKRELLSAGRS